MVRHISRAKYITQIRRNYKQELRGWDCEGEDKQDRKDSFVLGCLHIGTIQDIKIIAITISILILQETAIGTRLCTYV